MRLVATLITALALASCGSAHIYDPAETHPQLHTVAAVWSFRFLEYRVCSPAHCWSDSYLQCLRSYPQAVRRTTPIPELSFGHVVQAARWHWRDSKPYLEVEAVPSHGTSDPYTTVLRPTEDCSYQLTRK